MFTKTQIEKYFVAEKQESLLFLIIGMLALVIALYFIFFMKSSYFKGASIPLFIVGFIQISVGWTVFKRCDSDRSAAIYAYDMNPGFFKEKEYPRMTIVNRRFVVYRWVEMALAGIGIIMLFYFTSDSSKLFFTGLAMTLTIQSLFMLCADFFAEKRALKYTSGIQWFIEHSKL
jgi:hypothetical protein